jgi:hypothetical protein
MKKKGLKPDTKRVVHSWLREELARIQDDLNTLTRRRDVLLEMEREFSPVTVSFRGPPYPSGGTRQKARTRVPPLPPPPAPVVTGDAHSLYEALRLASPDGLTVSELMTITGMSAGAVAGWLTVWRERGEARRDPVTRKCFAILPLDNGAVLSQ